MRILLVTAWLLGCGAAIPRTPASTPRSSAAPTNGSGPSEDDSTECREEAPAGSLIARTYCRDKFERDGDRKDAEDLGHIPHAHPSMANH